MSMKISVITKVPNKANYSLVLAYFSKDKFTSQPYLKSLRINERQLVERFFKDKVFTGKTNEWRAIPRLGGGRIILLGLGEKNKWSSRRLIITARRLLVGLKAEKIREIIVPVLTLGVAGLPVDRLTQIVTENLVMADYEFNHYRDLSEAKKFSPDISWFIDKNSLSEAKLGLANGLVIGEQVNVARALGNIPGSEMTPEFLAAKARESGKAYKFKVEVLDKKQLAKLKMGAILGVAKGSHEEPKLIVMNYQGAKANIKPYVFVGKGVTFDSGGLNLKPGKSMGDMHLDMVGGAAVIAAISAIARLNLPVNVVGIVPAVENMLGGASYRPGDLLKSMSGKTIEILNTDAEGRVILADALTYADKFKPEAIIDVATLTGACMVALGLQASGLMSTNQDLQDEIIKIGETSGDYVWPLPMWEEYEDDVKGTFGDFQNEGKMSPYAGAIAGAMFLKQFVKTDKWAHLDIAGPMKTFDGQYLAKGASGVGVRLLIEFVRNKLAKNA